MTQRRALPIRRSRRILSRTAASSPVNAGAPVNLGAPIVARAAFDHGWNVACPSSSLATIRLPATFMGVPSLLSHALLLPLFVRPTWSADAVTQRRALQIYARFK